MPIQPGINPANAASQQPTGPIDKRNISAQITDVSGALPQTDVAIKNAVGDLAGILSEITSTQNGNIEDMSPEIQKLVQQILQDSFSVDKTLGQSLGDTLQARRYAFDQLASLGKMLSQLGELAENGSYTGLPDNVKTLLNNFRSVLTQNNQYPSTVDLLKTAFNLLNDKTVADLPEPLQKLADIYLPNNDASATAKVDTTNGMQSNQNNNIQVLKNILNTFFTDDTARAYDNKNVIGRQATPASTEPSLQNTTVSMPPLTVESKGGEQNISLKPNTNAGADTAVVQQGTAGAEEKSVVTAKGSVPESTDPTTNIVTAQKKAVGNEIILPANAEKTAPNIVQQGQPSGGTGEPMASNSTLQAAQLPDFINNTAKSVGSLRDLGQLLLQNVELSAQDKLLLRNFVNDSQQMLSPKDAAQLQKVMQVVENNIPGIVLQAAAKHNIPNLAKLWAFVQLSDISTIDDKAASLKQAGDNVSSFTKMMNNSFPTDSSAALSQKSLDFILPVFLDEQKSYPAYVNIYNEGHRNQETGEEQYETWFRVCCLTENVGAVEIVLRLYNKQQLNVRLSFSSKDTAVSFEDYLPKLRSYLHSTKLNLTELKIGTID